MMKEGMNQNYSGAICGDTICNPLSLNSSTGESKVPEIPDFSVISHPNFHRTLLTLKL